MLLSKGVEFNDETAPKCSLYKYHCQRHMHWRQWNAPCVRVILVGLSVVGIASRHESEMALPALRHSSTISTDKFLATISSFVTNPFLSLSRQRLLIFLD
jgi:hypothetical protein